MKLYLRLMAIILLLALGFRRNLNEVPIAVQVDVIPSGTSIGAVAWSPDGQYIAYSDLLNDTVMVWDIKQEAVVHTFQGEVYGVNSLNWSDDGRYLAASGNWAIVWDITDGTTYPRRDILDFVVNIGDLAWQPETHNLIYIYWGVGAETETSNSVVRLWNIDTQQLIQIGFPLTSFPRITWNPAGTYLAISDSECLQIRDVARSTVVSDVRRLGRVVDFDWSGDGQMIAIATTYPGPSKYIQIHGVFKSKLVAGPNVEGLLIQDIDWNPEHDVIAYIDDNRTVYLWDLDFNKIIFQTTFPSGVGRQANYATGPVEWSEDGQFLATIDGTGNIIIWKVYL